MFYSVFWVLQNSPHSGKWLAYCTLVLLWGELDQSMKNNIMGRLWQAFSSVVILWCDSFFPLHLKKMDPTVVLHSGPRWYDCITANAQSAAKQHTYNMTFKKRLSGVLPALAWSQDCMKAAVGYNEKQMSSVAPKYLPKKGLPLMCVHLS